MVLARLGYRLSLGDPYIRLTKLVDDLVRGITSPAHHLSSLIHPRSLTLQVEQFEGGKATIMGDEDVARI